MPGDSLAQVIGGSELGVTRNLADHYLVPTSFVDLNLALSNEVEIRQ
ncbi:MAG: hypothetical protein Q8906_14695 [Bacillota bacterium]|nr:hypothetical protein [Bacillota bacterium]